MFFAKLLQLFYLPAEYCPHSPQESQQRVISVLRQWVMYRYEDIDPTTRDIISDFIQDTLPAEFPREAHELSQTVDKMRAVEQQRLEADQFLPILPLQWHDSVQPSIYQYFLGADESIIAEQLTLHDWNLFQFLRSSELIGLPWQRKRHCASHLMKLIQRLHDVSYWVPSLILWSEKIKERGAVLWKFIRIAQELHRLRNYHSLMGIVSGLSVTSIQRLKYTFTMLSDQQIQEMEEIRGLLNRDNGYKRYRDEIKNEEFPSIPCL